MHGLPTGQSQWKNNSSKEQQTILPSVCNDGRKEDGGFVGGGNIVKQLQPCNCHNIDDHLLSLTNC